MICLSVDQAVKKTIGTIDKLKSKSKLSNDVVTIVPKINKVTIALCKYNC